MCIQNAQDWNEIKKSEAFKKVYDSLEKETIKKPEVCLEIYFSLLDFPPSEHRDRVIDYILKDLNFVRLPRKTLFTLMTFVNCKNNQSEKV